MITSSFVRISVKFQAVIRSQDLLAPLVVAVSKRIDQDEDGALIIGAAVNGIFGLKYFSNKRSNISKRV